MWVFCLRKSRYGAIRGKSSIVLWKYSVQPLSSAIVKTSSSFCILSLGAAIVRFWWHLFGKETDDIQFSCNSAHPLQRKSKNYPTIIYFHLSYILAVSFNWHVLENHPSLSLRASGQIRPYHGLDLWPQFGLLTNPRVQWWSLKRKTRPLSSEPRRSRT